MRHSGVFSREKLPSDGHSHLGWESFTELFLPNIMKYVKNDIYRQINIQGTSWSDFWDYLITREGSFNFMQMRFLLKLRTYMHIFDFMPEHPLFGSISATWHLINSDMLSCPRYNVTARQQWIISSILQLHTMKPLW